MSAFRRSLLRVAHRGGSLLAPENTLAAFRNALTMPVDMIELDVQMSRDGHAIVFHDATVDRLTNGTGNVLDLDFDYLRSLNAATHFPGGWPQPEQIPTLHEVLKLARNRVSVCIEIKLGQRDGSYKRYPKIAEAIVREVRATRMIEQVLVVSFDWVTLSHIHRLEPALLTGAMVSREFWTPEDDPQLQTLCKQVTAAGCNWINIDATLFTPNMLSIIHHNGFKLGVGIVNTFEELQTLAKAGVNFLMTDRPDLFTQL
jgi:glycerophosphoryl diester phosphodiesterase